MDTIASWIKEHRWELFIGGIVIAILGGGSWISDVGGAVLVISLVAGFLKMVEDPEERLW